VTGNTDGRCRRRSGGTEKRWAAKHRGPVNAVAFSQDGFVATASNDRFARLFDQDAPDSADDHQPRWAQQHPSAVTHVVTGPDFVATAAQDRRIRVLDLATGAVRHEFDHDARIRALTVGANGTIASASDDGSASVITGGNRRRIEHDGPVGLVAVNSDGSLVATAGPDVRVWRADGTPLHRFTPAAPVTALGFEADGALVVATEDPVARVLDPVSGSEIGRLIHPKPVRCLAFGAGGVVTGCDDHVVRMFEVRP
jgi:WD40 repeat protein